MTSPRRPSSLEDEVQPTAEPAPVVTTVTHLLRHGQTEHTPERRFSGRNELPLSLTGRAEAEAAAVRAGELGIEVVVASPLRRTRETAEIVAAALGLPVRVRRRPGRAGLRRPGGADLDEARTKHPLATRRFMSDVSVAAPGGESMADVTPGWHGRGDGSSPSTPAGPCSSSATSRRSSSAGRRPRRRRRRRPPGVPGGGVALHGGLVDDGRTSVRVVNDTSHLR